MFEEVLDDKLYKKYIRQINRSNSIGRETKKRWKVQRLQIEFKLTKWIIENNKYKRKNLY